MKKKLAVTTLAAAVAVSALAGLPQSPKGLAEKMGFTQTASAAGNEFLDQPFMDNLAALRGKLTAGDLTRIRQARAMLKTRFLDPAADGNLELIRVPINKIEAKGVSLTADEEKELYGFFAALVTVPYDVDGEHIEEIRNRPPLRAVLNKLAANTSGANQVTDLTVAHIVGFISSVEEEGLKILQGKSLSELYAINDSREKRNEVLQAVLTNVMAKDNPVTRIVKDYGIDAAITKDVILGFNGKLTVDERSAVRDAAIRIGLGFLALNTPAPNPTPTSPGIIVPPAERPAGLANDAAVKLGELADNIANATGEARKRLIEQVLAAAITAITEIGNFNASGKAVTVGGETTVQLGISDLKSTIDAIKKVVDALKAVAPDAVAELPELILTVKVDSATGNAAEVGLDAATIAAATAAGIAGVQIELGSGFSAILPLGGQINGAATLTVSSQAIHQDGAASDAFELGLTVDGKAVTAFDEPIEVSIPLTNAAGKDEQLLALAKLDEGKLRIVGGKVVNGKLVEKRSEFSQYVVVENKVSFNDIASVQAWAGRPITVVAAKGSINGKAAGVFAPTDKVTRAEFATMLIGALDLESRSATESFIDVQGTEWFAPYVAAAVKHGIITGRSETVFAPSATITRAEMAAMISRAVKVTARVREVTDADAALKGFSDAPSINASLKAGVALAASKGLVIGNKGKFNPNGTATRAEAAVVIYRALNVK
ncbi:S-layer homology domain-containing protein [Paenibacillus darwinianus]|uniref:S-layer homology domain-containing protein n=1 Tax=Paenibacillus darwinianus TaxID=1380763 RepID=UPI001681812E|nr:S-layer homology domain-containing protein [Paenibacillus darwinianus]